MWPRGGRKRIIFLDVVFVVVIAVGCEGESELWAAAIDI